MMAQILSLEPTAYSRHPVHGPGREWAETNCYVDVWIELLHAWGFDPVAALPFTLAIDFEGDQWTFFKYPPADLYEIYGLEVLELAIWRPLVDHVEEQVRQGRPVLVELDSYHLPDTAGTAYRREHVKSTVAVNSIDIPGRRLGYFHSQGYYTLEGDDFVDVFRLREPRDPAQLPPYVEFVRRRPGTAARPDQLVRRSLDLLRRHLSRLPEVNPFERFKPRFEADLRWLAEAPLEMFHQYSFATLRQFGACFELAATYLRWLAQRGVLELDRSVTACDDLAAGAKALQFRLARAVGRKKPLELSALEHMAGLWQSAVADLRTKFL